MLTKDLRFDETVREHELGGNTKRKTTGANLVWMIWRYLKIWKKNWVWWIHRRKFSRNGGPVGLCLKMLGVIVWHGKSYMWSFYHSQVFHEMIHVPLGFDRWCWWRYAEVLGSCTRRCSRSTRGQKSSRCPMLQEVAINDEQLGYNPL